MTESFSGRTQQPANIMQLLSITAGVAVPVISGLLLLWGKVESMDARIDGNSEKIAVIRSTIIELDPPSRSDILKNTDKIMNELRMNRDIFLQMIKKK